MDGICLTCGRYGDVEAHHVAGERNHKTLTVTVCQACHFTLSSWQQSAGIELHRTTPGTEADAARALIVGAVHLIQLYAHRHPGHSWITMSTSIHASRAMSRLMDSVLPPHREGRWLPDPTIPPHQVPTEVWPPGDLEALWMRDFAQLALGFATAMGSIPPYAVDTLTAMVVDPVWWFEQLRVVQRDPESEQRLTRRVIDYTFAVQKLVLLVLDPQIPPDTDQRLVDELHHCLESSRRLMVDLAELITNADPNHDHGDAGQDRKRSRP